MSAPAAAPDLALLGVVESHSKGNDARRESSYSVQTGGIVVTYSCTVLASLGLNTYLRGKGGEAGTVRGGAFCREVHAKF